MSDITKSDFFQLSSAQNDEKVGSKYFFGALTSFSDSLTCLISKGYQKQSFLCIEISLFFGVNNFRKTLGRKLFVHFQNV